MRGILVILLVVVVIGVAAFAFGYVQIRQTRTASLPELKLEGGRAPAFDVQAANVSVGEKKEAVTVPTANVQKPQ